MHGHTSRKVANNTWSAHLLVDVLLDVDTLRLGNEANASNPLNVGVHVELQKLSECVDHFDVHIGSETYEGLFEQVEV